MQLSFSNIAWQADEDLEAYDLLSSLGYRHVEVAPGRLWAQPAAATAREITDSLAALRSRSLAVSGFQAILFGRGELALFNQATRSDLHAYLEGLVRTCSQSGGKYLVFGAPRNRQVPAELSPDEAFQIAADFFREVGAVAAAAGVTIGIEANPAEYGCNFCTHVEEVIRLVSAVNSPGVRWHLDTGELKMNQESLPVVITANAQWIGSVHVSEPQLAAFDSPWADHPTVASALAEAGYQGAVAVEMKRAPDGLTAVRRAAEYVRKTYL